MLRHLAQELAAGSKPNIVVEGLQRDYAYSPAPAARFIASARTAISDSPALRGDEEIVSNLEASSRSSAARLAST